MLNTFLKHYIDDSSICRCDVICV